MGIFGGGGGGGGSSSGTQEQIAREAPGVESRKLALYDEAVKLAQQPITLPQYQVAAPTQLQQNAFTAAGQTGIGQGAVNQGIASLQAGAAPIGAADISRYFNPYQSYVTDEISRQGQMQQNQLAGQAVQAGAFGGGREGVQQAEIQKATQQNIGQSQAQGFTNASQLAAQQQQAQLAGGQALLGAGGQQQAMAQGDIQSMIQAGGIQQQLGQQALDASRQSQLQQAYEPYQRTEFLKGIMTNLPTTQSSITATTAPGTNPLSQAAGAGLGAYAAYNIAKKKEGGIINADKYIKVRKFNVGGGVFSDEEKTAYMLAPVVSELLTGTKQAGRSNIAGFLSDVGEGIAKVPAAAIEIKKLEVAANKGKGKSSRLLTPEEVVAQGFTPGSKIQINSEGTINVIQKPSEAELKNIRDTANTMNTLNSIETQYNKLGKPVGPWYNFDTDRIGGALSGMVGGEAGKNLRQFDADVVRLGAEYMKAISGATVPDEERVRLERVIPTTSDTEAEFEGKIKGMKTYLKDALEMAKATGMSGAAAGVSKMWEKKISIDSYLNKGKLPSWKITANGLQPVG
jgi:hypothetical protein